MKFPPLEPFATGHLPVTDNNQIYWEASGNPKGQPALYLHGGPGSGIKAGYRRYFDPEKFLIVSFEQRGCGRSRPLVTEAMDSLKANTTQALIADIEKLRLHFGAKSWLLTGMSWGTTLALAYAQAHPNRVRGVVLAAITTTSSFEVDWTTEQMRRLFPQQWDLFAEAVRHQPGQRLIDRYYSAITHADPKVREQAASAWCKWEDVHVSLDPQHTPYDAFQDPAFRLIFASLVIHYWKHAGFAEAPGLKTQMHRLALIPGVLIHGRWDISSPAETAWDLHTAWPSSELIIVEDEGHGGPKMIEELARGIERVSAKAEKS